jgi:hypothetical protein
LILNRPDQDIVLAQSADPVNYFAMLRATSRINRAYCLAHRIHYICHHGIIRGFHPWQASHNRIYILDELLSLGFEGWYLHLDSDAWVNDLSFKLRAYLTKLGLGTSFVFAQGGTSQAWDVNDGAFLANLAHPDTREVIRAWRASAESASLRHLRAATDWSQGPRDQQMLQDILRAGDARLTAHIHHESFNFFNGIKGSFVRQMLQHHQPDPALRLQAIELEVETALTRQNVATEDAIATFCGMARALGLPIPNDPAQISAIMADKAALAAFLRQAVSLPAGDPAP